MIKIEKIDNIINICKLLKKEKVQYDKAVINKKNQYDLAQKALYIDKISHKLHCACVEWWVASFDEWRYGDKIRNNWRNEITVFYEKPNV